MKRTARLVLGAWFPLNTGCVLLSLSLCAACGGTKEGGKDALSELPLGDEGAHDSAGDGFVHDLQAADAEDASGEQDTTPSDDPAAWPPPPAGLALSVGDPVWVVPSDALPSENACQIANNNEDIEFFAGRLFLAWRTARSHFAAADVQMNVASSPDRGKTWQYEARIDLGTDMREPRFLAMNGKLQLMFFQAGTNPAAFEPLKILRIRRNQLGDWTLPEEVTSTPEVPWDVKVRNGIAYMTSYTGGHYDAGMSTLQVHFQQSDDGLEWAPVDGAAYVYQGGVSEVAFEFDATGNLWAVTRNEDGDASGFGAHVCFAPKDSLALWECSTPCDPNRYDSPEMFRFGDEIYLAARRDDSGPYDQGRTDLSFDERKSKYLMDYSFGHKGTALYRINQQLRTVEHLLDLPGTGDNAFPAVRRSGPNSFLLSNYTNPLNLETLNWLEGQIHPLGTQIYFLELEFR